MLKNISIHQCTCLVLCIGLGCSFSISAAEKVNNFISNVDMPKRVADADYDGMQQTLNLNFSPENREKLRRALSDYGRSADPDHGQIEERRRAMQDSIKTRFLEADSDGDGTIDRQEATEKLPQIARHFNMVDTNQDGLISLEELQAAQARILERRKAAEAALEAQKNQETETTTTASVKRKNNKQQGSGANKPVI